MSRGFRDYIQNSIPDGWDDDAHAADDSDSDNSHY
jgi:hypothetical protein